MLRLAITVVALSGCSSSLLTGNPTEDLATLTAEVDVDCDAEQLCGEIPHCLRDALHDGKIGVVHQSNPVFMHSLFSYDGAIIDISQSSSGSALEVRCAQLVVVAEPSNCWSWRALQCESL